jgi:hypothetical protein
MKDGVERLYFLARDSWLPYAVAKQLVKRREYSIDLRYIYVSRYTLRNAEYAFIGEEALETICVGGIDITFRKMMKRANLTDAEIAKVASEIGFENRIDEYLSYAQTQDVKNRLYNTKTIFEIIENKAKASYESIKEYFLQEGLCDDIKYALVDSGWLGTTQQSLQKVVSQIKKENTQIMGYYFGLYELPKEANKMAYKSYYLMPNKTIKRKVRFSICLFETVLSAPCGMTLGYKNIDGKWEPVCSEMGNLNSNKMNRYYDLITEYVKNFDINQEFLNTDYVNMISKLLGLLMGQPVRAEARAMGALMFCDDVLESSMQNVARIWGYEELKKQRFVRKIFYKFFNSNVKLHESGWPEGSIVNLCGEGVKARFALWNERFYKKGMYLRKSMKEK